MVLLDLLLDRDSSCICIEVKPWTHTLLFINKVNFLLVLPSPCRGEPKGMHCLYWDCRYFDGLLLLHATSLFNRRMVSIVLPVAVISYKGVPTCSRCCLPLFFLPFSCLLYCSLAAFSSNSQRRAPGSHRRVESIMEISSEPNSPRQIGR